MKTTRPSFLLYKSFHEPVKNLSLEEKGMLFDAIFNFQNNIVVENLPMQVAMAFAFFKNQFDLDGSKYKQTCDKNAENIRLYWEKQKALQGNTTEYERIGMNTMATDKEKEKEKEIDKGKEIDKPKKPKGFTPPTLEEVKNYCKEKNINTDPDKFFKYYDVGDWKDKEGKQVKNWKQKLISWESRSGESKPQSNDNLVDNLNKIIGEKWIEKVHQVEDKAIISISQENWKKLANLEQSKRDKIKEEIFKTLGNLTIKQKYTN